MFIGLLVVIKLSENNYCGLLPQTQPSHMFVCFSERTHSLLMERCFCGNKEQKKQRTNENRWVANIDRNILLVTEICLNSRAVIGER